MGKAKYLTVILVGCVALLFVADLVKAAIAVKKKQPYKSILGEWIESMCKDTASVAILLGIAAAYIYGLYILAML